MQLQYFELEDLHGLCFAQVRLVERVQPLVYLLRQFFFHVAQIRLGNEIPKFVVRKLDVVLLVLFFDSGYGLLERVKCLPAVLVDEPLSLALVHFHQRLR